MEDFVLSEDREKVLAQLLPGNVSPIRNLCRGEKSFAQELRRAIESLSRGIEGRQGVGVYPEGEFISPWMALHRRFGLLAYHSKRMDKVRRSKQRDGKV